MLEVIGFWNNRPFFSWAEFISSKYPCVCCRGYNVQIVNPSRPDLLESAPIAPPFWPPSVNTSQASSVLILHAVEVLQTLANVDFRTIFEHLISWLALENGESTLVK